MKKYQNIGISILFYILLIIMWQKSFNPLVPTPKMIALSLIEISPLIKQDILYTLTVAFSGLVLGLVFAVSVVVLMDISNVVKSIFNPVIVTSQAIPFNIIAPAVVILFGFGIMPKIYVVALVVFFPLALNLLSAFDNIDKSLLDVATIFGAGKLQKIYYLKFPQSMPAFFSGLKIGAVYSISSAVIAEWMAGDSGIGVFMLRAKRSYQGTRVFAVAIIIIVLSLLLYYIFNYIKKITERNVN